MNTIFELVNEKTFQEIVKVVCKEFVDSFAWLLLFGGRCFAPQFADALREDMSCVLQLFEADWNVYYLDQISKPLKDIINVIAKSDDDLIKLFAQSNDDPIAQQAIFRVVYNRPRTRKTKQFVADHKQRFQPKTKATKP